MKNIQQITIAAFAIILTGCATGDKAWTDAQKASLNKITISPITFTDDAYRSPRAISSGKATQELGNVVNFNGLPIGLLAGAVIDGAVAGVQQSKYNTLYGAHYPLIETSIKKTAENADDLVFTELKKSPFIATRIAPNSSNKLNITINKHGLTRFGKTTVENMDLVYFVEGSSSLTNENGDTLMSNNLSHYSKVSKMDAILKNPQTLVDMQKDAYQSLGTNLMYKINYLASPAVVKP